MKFLAVLDGFGVYGTYYHYSMVLAFVGSALLIFLYLKRKGLLNMDEEPKYLLLKEDEEESGEKKEHE